MKRWIAALLLLPAVATAIAATARRRRHSRAAGTACARRAADCAVGTGLRLLRGASAGDGPNAAGVPKAVELVTVATDDIAQRDAIERRLRDAGMTRWPARAYAEATPERLNYLLDPDWGGETPRVPVIRADGSGMATAANSRRRTASDPPRTASAIVRTMKYLAHDPPRYAAKSARRCRLERAAWSVEHDACPRLTYPDVGRVSRCHQCNRRVHHGHGNEVIDSGFPDAEKSLSPHTQNAPAGAFA